MATTIIKNNTKSPQTYNFIGGGVTLAAGATYTYNGDLVADLKNNNPIKYQSLIRALTTSKILSLEASPSLAVLKTANIVPGTAKDKFTPKMPASLKKNLKFYVWNKIAVGPDDSGNSNITFTEGDVVTNKRNDGMRVTEYRPTGSGGPTIIRTDVRTDNDFSKTYSYWLYDVDTLEVSDSGNGGYGRLHIGNDFNSFWLCVISTNKGFSGVRLSENDTAIGIAPVLDSNTFERVPNIDAVAKNKWHNFTAVVNRKNKTGKVYKNGELIASTTAAGDIGIAETTETLYVAIYLQHVSRIIANLKGIGYWERALTIEEVKALAFYGKPVNILA